MCVLSFPPINKQFQCYFLPRIDEKTFEWWKWWPSQPWPKNEKFISFEFMTHLWLTHTQDWKPSERTTNRANHQLCFLKLFHPLKLGELLHLMWKSRFMPCVVQIRLEKFLNANWSHDRVRFQIPRSRSAMLCVFRAGWMFCCPLAVLFVFFKPGLLCVSCQIGFVSLNLSFSSNVLFPSCIWLVCSWFFGFLFSCLVAWVCLLLLCLTFGFLLGLKILLSSCASGPTLTSLCSVCARIY